MADDRFKSSNIQNALRGMAPNSGVRRKLLIVAAIIGVTFAVVATLSATRPQADKRPAPETIVRVDVVKVAPSNYPIIVNTNGTIQADTRGNLVAQIRGEIIRVAESFRSGGRFAKGDVLVEIDSRDYAAELSQASAAVSQARAIYSQEQANARQAKRDWERLGNVGDAPELVLRQPQLDAAKAQLESALARYQTAKLNLERTQIKAPYAGRIISRTAALGQYVSIGTPIAEVFASDLVEVRLPLSQAEFTQLGLDRAFAQSSLADYAVKLTSQVGSSEYTWSATLSRADSIFDLNTRQIDVFARVVDPFSSAAENTTPPVKIGQFVNATITGPVLENVTVIPNKALREGSYVFVVEDGLLVRTPVVVTWQDDQNALIKSGLNQGDLVVTTSLNSTLAGAKVKLPEAFLVAPQTEQNNEPPSDATQP